MKKLFIVLLLCSCNYNKPYNPKLLDCDYTISILIDDLFSQSEKDEIAIALSDWNVASDNRICFNTSFYNTKNDERTFLIDNKYAIYSWKRKWQIHVATTSYKTPCKKREDCLAVTIWHLDGKHSDIFILSEDLKFLRPTVEHEVGHILGLSHTGHYDNIMYMYLNPNKKIGNQDRKVLQCLIRNGQLFNRFNVCF